MSNNLSILITRPDFDCVTRYLSAWSGELVKDYKKKNIKVYDLSQDKVTRKNFESFIKKQQPDIVFLNGHGNGEEISGHDNQVILDSNNASLMKNLIVYALACKSAKKLGLIVIQQGGKGYIGYKEDFIMMSQPSKTTHPLRDDTAMLFLNPSNVIANSLVKGQSVSEAFLKGQEAFMQSIKKALNSNIQSDLDKCVSFLYWNLKNLTYHC